MEKMQAVIFDKCGDPQVLRSATLPIPTVTADTVLIKVAAVAVDHVDTFVRSGAFATELATPHIVGRDLVGQVIAVGANVTTFTVGQWVWSNSLGYDGRMGATAEVVVAAANRVYPVPTGVDKLQLVAAVHSAATAAIVLKTVMTAHAGQRLLVEGAAGNVGRKLVQLGRQLGLTVATTSNSRDFEWCRRLGSAVCYDYHGDLLAQMGPTPQLFDQIIDTSGKVALQTSLDCLAQGGQVTLITAPQDNQFTFDVRQFYMNQKRIAGFVISHASQQQLHDAAAWLNQEFQQGHLLEDHVEQRSFAAAARVHTAMETGQDRGRRFVLVPSLVQ